jgi:hypothetical protein
MGGLLAKSAEVPERKRIAFCGNVRKCKKAQKSAELLDSERLMKRSLSRERKEGRESE